MLDEAELCEELEGKASSLDSLEMYNGELELMGTSEIETVELGVELATRHPDTPQVGLGASGKETVEFGVELATRPPDAPQVGLGASGNVAKELGVELATRPMDTTELGLDSSEGRRGDSEIENCLGLFNKDFS